MGVTEIQIRATEPGDADALHDIFSGPRAVAGTLQLPWVSVEARRPWLQHDPNLHSLVATTEGRVVGQAGLHLQTRGRRRDCADIGMAVHDDFQGRGVGTALMAALMEL